MPRIALAFAAHPDDAEILCGGTLVRLADAGWEIHIATMTAGDCGTVSETPWAISHRRTEEARKAVSLIGGTYHCLGELDCFIMYDKPTVRKGVELLRRVGPSLVFTLAPRDYMVDHEMASLVARACCFQYTIPNISASPLREGSQVPYLYYCDPVDAKDPFGNVVAPTTLVDISGQLEKKLEMLACHASQREWLRAHHGIDEYIESTRRHSAMRGKQLGTTAAEAFVQHRGHGYPHDDILLEMFPKA
jgi:LmbE family N-acetylglucosaminyl deacetylase